jgi:hypothetical protein
MFTQLQALLGITIPVQFEPVLTAVCAVLLLYQLVFFCEMLKLIILRR